jgi:hypothetical protein
MSERPEDEPEGDGERPPAEAAAPDRVQRTCPVCGSELEERKCKLLCPRPGCGYFLSCADFY